MSSHVSDSVLLERWDLGDREAGALLYQRYTGDVCRFFRNKAEEDLPDLVQLTFLTCLENRKRFRGESTFRVYLLQTARFLLYEFYRTKKRDSVLEYDETAADVATSPFSMLVTKQDECLLLEALRRIPLDQQVILALVFWEELSGRELAAVLEIPEATGRTRLRRALLRLKGELIRLVEKRIPLERDVEDLHRWSTQVRAEWASRPVRRRLLTAREGCIDSAAAADF